jgi:streptogramin lyase
LDWIEMNDTTWTKTLVALSLIGLGLGINVHAQDAVPNQPKDTTGTRPASAVYPLDAVVDAQGAVWVVDRNAPGVWKFADNKLELAFPGSKRFREPLNAARAIAISKDGKLYVGDPATREVYVRTEANEMKPIMSGIIGIPMDIAVSSNGTLYVADAERRVVWSKAPDSEKPSVFAAANPNGLFVDAQDRIWVISKDEEQLQRFDPSGKKEVLVPKRIFEFAHQIVVDSSGTAWITDGYKKALWRLAEGGQPEIVVSGAPLMNPVGLLLIDDKPVIVDPHAQSLFKLNASNQLELWFQIAKP